ncbi:hypothetical protein CEPID_01655 [Corynebacterium epidermidicanis]|uniref:Uncharacterized protein n=1 Tax=Corynebacterium epidermidicanis TaxID=1050174 RepID=A0A0G3GLZ0_9CORY|nr:hypothetical protein CEPID_01655 [Corynebacterium epidermidicanis]
MVEPQRTTHKENSLTAMRWVHNSASMLAFVALFFTWAYLTATASPVWQSVFGTRESRVTFLLASFSIVVFALSTAVREGVRGIGFMLVGIGLNFLGILVASLTDVPLYLDAVGTVIIANIFGARAGAATGMISLLIWSFIEPTNLPFVVLAGIIGLLAGVLAQLGAFGNVVVATLYGAVVGLMSGVLSAPLMIISYLDAPKQGIFSFYAEMLMADGSIPNALLMKAIYVDTLDKIIVFVLAYVSLNVLRPYLLKKPQLW